MAVGAALLLAAASGWPLAAAAALALTWIGSRRGRRWSVPAAALVLVALVAYVLRSDSIPLWRSGAAAGLLALAGTSALWSRRARRDDEVDPMLERIGEYLTMDPAPSRPDVVAIPRSRRLEISGQQADARAALAQVGSYLSDVRESLVAEDVILWRIDDTMREGPSVARPVASATVRGTEAMGNDAQRTWALVKWAAAENLTVAGEEPDGGLLVVAPVRKGIQLYGAMSVRVRGTSDTARLRGLVERLGSHLGVLLDLLANNRKAQRYRRRTEALLSAAERLHLDLEMEKVGKAMCSAALEVTGATRAAFVRWEPHVDEGVVQTTSASHPVAEGLHTPPESFVGMACRHQQRFTFEEGPPLSRAAPIYGIGEPPRDIRSLGIVPLVRSGSTIGAIVVEGDERGQLCEVEVNSLALLATVAALAWDTADQFETQREHAVRDALTGLWNRRRFEERREQALAESDRYGDPVSLIMFDIDYFKRVNDNMGHDAGDRVLKHVAQLVQREVRDVDVLARHGGEEFAVLLPKTPMKEAGEVANRIREAIQNHPLVYKDQPVMITASFGVTSYPEGTQEHEHLVSLADKALYQAKSNGRNRVAFSKATRALSGL